MGMNRLDILVLCLIGLTLVLISKAQDSHQDYLDPHNAARGAVGVGRMTWDDRVAAYAQNYASKMAASCDLVHSGGPYGENLAKSTGDFSAAGAVNLWVKEKQFYNPDANTCQNGKMCGHYTQVVWRDSVRLGCAKSRCNNGGTFIICSYDPRGNYVGRRPY